MNCKNCGAILNSNDMFCRQCGQLVNNNNQDQNYEIHEFNSYQNNNIADYKPDNQYNAYKNNSNIGKVILIIILAIVFVVVGFGLGKLLWGKDEDTNININDYQLNQQDTSKANNQSNSNKHSSVTNNKNENANQTNNQNRSYIITYNGTKVYFNIANTLKEDTSEVSDEEYRCFEKINGDDELLIWIGEEYGTINEYMLEIEDWADYIKQDREYNNIQLSEVKTKTVNGKNFLFRSLTYNMGDTKFQDLYIAYEIESESLYAIEVEQFQLLTDEELNGLLNITIER